MKEFRTVGLMNILQSGVLNLFQLTNMKQVYELSESTFLFEPKKEEGDFLEEVNKKVPVGCLFVCYEALFIRLNGEQCFAIVTEGVKVKGIVGEFFCLVNMVQENIDFYYLAQMIKVASLFYQELGLKPVIYNDVVQQRTL